MGRKTEQLVESIDSELLNKYICRYFKISLIEQLRLY